MPRVNILALRLAPVALTTAARRLPRRRDAARNPGHVLARRLEETGVTAARLQRLTSIWTTPGFTNEVIHLYLATGLTMGQPSRERDEFIEVVPQPLSRVLALIRDGEIRDAKTVVAILYMAAFS